MLGLWIILNTLNHKSFTTLIFANIRYKDLENKNTTNAFAYATITMNPIAVAQFFESISINITNHLLATGSNYGGFIGHVFTYFGIIETNVRGMFHLHYHVFLRKAHHLTEIRN